MDLSFLPNVQKKSYEKVTEYMAKNPGTTVHGAIKKTGAARTSYYTAAQRVKNRNVEHPKQKRKYVGRNIVMQSIPVAESLDNKIFALYGDSSIVIKALRELER